MIFIFVLLFYLNFSCMIFGSEYGVVNRYNVIFCDKMVMEGILGAELPMTLFGEKFLCKIPTNQDAQVSKNFLEKDIILYAYKINNMPCLGWYDGKEWFYNLCPKFGVFQIYRKHLMYSLGYTFYDFFISRKVLDFYGLKEKKYFTRVYTNGTTCPLTGQKRSTLVRFECNTSGSDKILYVTEVFSCRYEITVSTKHACSDEDFYRIPLYCGSAVDVKELIIKNNAAPQKLKLNNAASSNSNDFTKFHFSLKANETANNHNFVLDKTLNDRKPNKSQIYHAEDLEIVFPDFEHKFEEVSKKQGSNIAQLYFLQEIEDLKNELKKGNADSKKRKFKMIVF